MTKLSDEAAKLSRSFTRNDYWQRLQIGGAGLCGILVVAGITSVLLSNAADEPSSDSLLAEQQQNADGSPAEPVVEAPSEPLVDIGVVPDIAPDQSLGDPDQAMPEDNVPDLPADNGEEAGATTSADNGAQ
jgi:hypothetical protein